MSGSIPPFLFTNTTPSEGEPTVHLNYITFDRNYKPIYDDSQTYRVAVTNDALESGANGDHQELIAEVTIKQAGFMYIYLSNESATEQEVYFDDFSIEHIKSSVVEINDYYPFGLTFNSYSKENSLNQPYKFNGKEAQTYLNVNWLDYGARMYTPEIGRWWVVDPMSERTNSFSPYHYAYNNPIVFIDPDGQYAWYTNGNYYDYDQSGNVVQVGWGYVQDQLDHGDGIQAKVSVKGKGNIFLWNYLSATEAKPRKVDITGMQEGNENWDVLETSNGELAPLLQIISVYKKLNFAIHNIAIQAHGNRDRIFAVQDESGLEHAISPEAISDYKDKKGDLLINRHLDGLKEVAASISKDGNLFFLSCFSGARAAKNVLPYALGNLLLKSNSQINIWMPVGGIWAGVGKREVRFGEKGIENIPSKGWTLINRFYSKAPTQTLEHSGFSKPEKRL